MRGYVQLIRPLNAVMAAVGCLLGSVVAVPALTTDQLLFAGQAALIALLFTGAGNALNDYADRETDRVNHPDRPLPAGRVSGRGALVMAAVLFAATIPWSALLGPALLAIVLLNLGLMASYELLFKRGGFPGNLLISWLVASLFIFGGLAVYDSPSALQRVLLLALLAFLATLGREVVKDLEDVGGDVDRRTLPMTLGRRGAGAVAATAFLLGVGLSVVPYLLGILNVFYLIVVLVADGIFIYAARTAFSNPGLSQRAAKYAMLVALVAFLVGGFP